MLNSPTKRFVDVWVKLLKDIIKGRVNVTSAQLSKLTRLEREVREFTNPRSDLKSRARILSQKGGLLGLLAPIAKGLIGPLLGTLFGGGLGERDRR